MQLTDLFVSIVKDQIQVCNIIQKRFTNNSHNKRVNAQGVAKKRILQKFAGRAETKTDDGASISWPGNVPGLSRPPVLDKLEVRSGHNAKSMTRGRGTHSRMMQQDGN